MTAPRRKRGRPSLGDSAARTTSLRLPPAARALIEQLREPEDSVADVVIRGLCALRLIESDDVPDRVAAQLAEDEEAIRR